MSLKDTQFKFISGQNLSTTGLTTINSSSDFHQDGSNSFRSEPHGRVPLDGLTSVTRVKPTRLADESPESWPRRNPVKRSGSTRHSGRPETSTSDTMLSVQRQDSVELMWTSKTYSVEDLVGEFNGEFPIIVKVVHGYSGGEGSNLDLAKHQVLQIFNHNVQRRVSVTDSSSHEFSLPLDYHVCLKRLDTPHGVTHRLDSLLERVSLPISVQVTGQQGMDVDQSSAGVTAGGLIGSQLDVTSLYDSLYLSAHSIRDGWLDTINLLIVPQELGPVFRVAYGLKGADSEEWADYCGMFARVIRDVKMDSIVGYSNVIYKDWSSCRCGRRSSRRTSSSSPEGESVDEPPQRRPCQKQLANKLLAASVETQRNIASHPPRNVQHNSARICQRRTSDESHETSDLELSPKTERQVHFLGHSSVLGISSPEVSRTSKAKNNTQFHKSCSDLSSINISDKYSLNLNSCTDLRFSAKPKRPVPFMGTRDITHKFTYCNFKVRSPSGNWTENKNEIKEKQNVSFELLAKDDETGVINQDNTNYNEYDNNAAILANGTDITNSEERRDHSATLASTCGSTDDGYETKESTISSYGSVTYRKQFSPVYF